MAFSASASPSSYNDPYTTPPPLSSRFMNVTITPPSPIHHLELPRGASPSSSTINTSTENRQQQALLKLFHQEYNDFINFKHSIHSSSSNAHPEQSIILELEQLKVWTSKAMAFISSTLDKHTNVNTLDMVKKINLSISKSTDHIAARIQSLSPPSSPMISLPSSPVITTTLVMKKRPGTETPTSKTTTTTPTARSSGGGGYRLRDEKQSRDSIRRMVIAFYLKEYLQIQFQNTVPTTFICTRQFILNNKSLFATYINDFGNRIFNLGHDYFYPNNEHVVSCFIQQCQEEMQDVIAYLSHALKLDANEYNYDNSAFLYVPSVLMNRIRIRLVKDNHYIPMTLPSLDVKVEKTALRVFQHVNSRLITTSGDTTDTDTDDDYEMLTIMDDA